MQKDFENFFYEAEDHYLNPEEMAAFKAQVTQLKKRLAIYKELRNQEIPIFQKIADDLIKKFPQEQSNQLEKALKHWISIMRYGAMSILLNNPDYLRHRLLEWLTDMIHSQEIVAIEMYIHGGLKTKLEGIFSPQDMELINPFLVQSESILLGSKNATEIVSVGE